MTRKNQLEALIHQNREIVKRFPGCGDNSRNGPFEKHLKNKSADFFLKWNPDLNEDFEIGYEHTFIFYRALIEHPCEVNNLHFNYKI